MPKRMIHRKKMMERWVMGDKKNFPYEQKEKKNIKKMTMRMNEV